MRQETLCFLLPELWGEIEVKSMGVYIKGMKIPGECSDCRFVTWERGYVCLATSTPSALRETINDKRRPDFCPLVHVPDHGRLVDADALIERLGDTEYKGALKRVLIQAPTVIPASEEEKV